MLQNSDKGGEMMDEAIYSQLEALRKDISIINERDLNRQNHWNQKINNLFNKDIIIIFNEKIKRLENKLIECEKLLEKANRVNELYSEFVKKIYETRFYD